jgi:PKD repeat protein
MVCVTAAMCGYGERGEIVGWGYNQYGQAHDSPGMDAVEYVALAAGGDSSFALTTNGAIVGWGLNDYGQTDCPPGSNYTAVAAGNSFALALSNGYVIGWGDNTQGQLNGPSNQQFTAIAASGEHAMGLTEEGIVLAWGNNTSGQTNVPPNTQFVKVSAGQSHSVGILLDGSLLAWGGGSEGQTNCPPGNNYIAVVAGGYHNVALRGDGTLVSWGDSTADQTNCPPGNDYVDVAAGYYHSMALRADGSVVCWGNNGDGQTDAPEGYLFAGIAAGYSHSVALKVPGLTCRFSADRTIGLHTLPVQFSGQTSSTNAPNIYFAWDFQNDGVIDTQGFGANAPTHAYTAGVYSVRLFVSNLVDESAFYFRTNFIVVNDHGVVADFAVATLTGAAPLAVQFTDKSLFTPQYWQWDFDDDGSVDGSVRNPLYVFSTAGLYSVRLTVSNNFGAGSGASYDMLTRTNLILVYPNVIADFSVDKTRVITNEAVQFTDVSSNEPNAWYWDFDNDGTVDSMQQHPLHAYATAGYKSVRLLVSNNYSAAIMLKQRLIAVLGGGLTSHVFTAGSSVPPYDTWFNAATNIQDAVELSVPGGVVLISNGVYTSGGYDWYGANVFVVTNAVALVGCGAVVIDGRAALRGGYVAQGRVERLTFQHGVALGSNGCGYGGGLYATSGAQVVCCTMDGNDAVHGGGVYAADAATLYSTLIVSNHAAIGGGSAMAGGAAGYNCTVVDNAADVVAGGVDSSGASCWNAIVWDNTAPSGANYRVVGSNCFNFSCAAPLPGGASNIMAAPAFLAGYDLPPESPCADRGFTFAWAWTATDLAGAPRVRGAAGDQGAFEAVPEPAALGLVGLLTIYQLHCAMWRKRMQGKN